MKNPLQNFNLDPESLKKVTSSARQASSAFRLFGKLMSSLNVNVWDEGLEEGWLKVYSKEEL